MFGDPAKPEKQFLDVRAQANGDANHVYSNGKFMAFVATGSGGPVVIHPLDKPGRLPANPAKLLVHKGDVLDMDFSPFINNLIATCGEDAHIKVSSFPEGGLTENVTQAQVSLEGHERKTNYVHWHPTANNVLASSSYDNTIRVWDVSTGQEVLKYEDFQDNVQSFEWNEDGSQIVASSKDLNLRVFDPRDQKSVLKTPGFSGPKTSRVLWCNNLGKVAGVGFGKASERQYALWDPKNFSKPLTQVELDKQAGIMIPYFDPDNSILYFGSKGGSNIAYYEVTATEPYVHFLSEFRDNQSQRGLGWVPKRFLDVSKCEIALCLRLMRDSIVPVSFQVPRKSELFQKDIFPDCYAGVPSGEGKEYFAGANPAPKKMSLDPKQRGNAPQQLSSSDFKPVVGGGLQSQLEAANDKVRQLEARVAELEAQLAAAKV